MRSGIGRFVEREIGVLALFAFLGALALLRLPQQLYPDLIFSYPFITFDGFEWIAEANHYLDHGLAAKYRNPGLPLTIAAFKLLGSERFFPVLLVLLYVGFLASLYWLLRGIVSRGVACFTVLSFSFCFRIQSLFDVVLADSWAILLQVLSMALLLRAADRPRNLLAAALFAGLSFNYQYAIAFVLPAYAYFVHRELGSVFSSERRRTLLWAVALGLATAAPHFVHLLSEVGTLFPVSKDPTRLVGLHFFGLFPYAVNFLAFLGIPFAAVVVVGFATSLGDPRPRVQFFHYVLFGNFLFWVLLYAWIDARFLIYFVPCFAFYFAYGVTRAGILGWFDPRRRPAALCLLMLALYLLGIELAGYEETQSRKDLLPIAPKTALLFPSVENPVHPVNRTIGLAGTKLLQAQPKGVWSPFTGHYSWYRNARRRPRREAVAMRDDLALIEAKLPDDQEPVGLCGSLLPSLPRLAAQTRLQILDRLRRNLTSDCRAVEYQIHRVGDGLHEGSSVVLEGASLSLRRRGPLHESERPR